MKGLRGGLPEVLAPGCCRCPALGSTFVAHSEETAVRGTSLPRADQLSEQLATDVQQERGAATAWPCLGLSSSEASHPLLRCVLRLPEPVNGAIGL